MESTIPAIATTGLTQIHILPWKHFQHQFSVNIWCVNTGDHLIGPTVIKDLMTVTYYLNFLQNSQSLLLQDIPLQTRLRMWFQHDGVTPHAG
jgi:hypothetical protein